MAVRQEGKHVGREKGRQVKVVKPKLNTKRLQVKKRSMQFIKLLGPFGQGNLLKCFSQHPYFRPTRPFYTITIFPQPHLICPPYHLHPTPTDIEIS